MAAREVRAGKSYVELSLRNKLDRGLRAAQRRLGAFGKTVAASGAKALGLGASVVAAGLAAVSQFAKVGDQLDKTSKRTGVSVEALSELAFAAEQSGADMQTLEKGVKGMQKTLNNANRGLSTSVDALADVGLKAKELEGLSPEQQFLKLSQALSEVEDPSKRAALAMEIFGRAGQQLVPLISGGAAGIDALRQEAREAGITISTDAAQSAAEYTDAMNKLRLTLRGVTQAIGGALVPVLKPLVEKARGIVKEIAGWLAKNATLVRSLFKIAAIVAGVGLALIALGGVIILLGAGFGAAATIVGVVTGAFSALAAVVAAVLSPLGLVTAAVIGLGAVLEQATGFGGKAIEYLKGRFQALADFTKKAFKGIGDALAAGDIGLAARILWLSLKVIFQKGISALQSLWARFSTFMIGLAADAFYGAAIVLNNAIASMQQAWLGFTSWLGNKWADVKGDAASAWNLIGVLSAKAANRIRGAFDDSFDVKKANASAEAEFVRAQHEIELENAKQRAAIDKAQAERAAAIDSDRAGTEKVLVGKADQAEAARKASRDKAIADSEGALAAARQEWEDAIAKAKQARDNTPDDGTAPTAPKFDFDAFADSIESGLKAATLADAGKARGTFNAEAIQSLQVDSLTARIAEATEATAKNTKRLYKAPLLLAFAP